MYWIGPVDTKRSMRQALNTEVTPGTHFVAIRENGFKVFKELHDGSPNPAYVALTEGQQAEEDLKPSFWGTWTRTANDPVLRSAAWDRDPSRYGPWASGHTLHPLTKEQVAALEAGSPAAQLLNAPEPKATPRRGKGPGREQSRA